MQAKGGEEVKKEKQFALAFAPVFIAMAVAFAGCASGPSMGDSSPTGPSASGGPPRGSGTGLTGAQEDRVAPRPLPSERDITSGGPQAGQVPASALKDAFFDYNKSTLTDDAKRGLNDNAAWLRANSQARITVEGHCDERGTAEYNLGLGDRRARAVREYLVAAGIDVTRIRTISYGKERPFNLGHDESAWRENRRGHFVIDR